MAFCSQHCPVVPEEFRGSIHAWPLRAAFSVLDYMLTRLGRRRRSFQLYTDDASLRLVLTEGGFTCRFVHDLVHQPEVGPTGMLEWRLVASFEDGNFIIGNVRPVVRNPNPHALVIVGKRHVNLERFSIVMICSILHNVEDRGFDQRMHNHGAGLTRRAIRLYAWVVTLYTVELRREYVDDLDGRPLGRLVLENLFDLLGLFAHRDEVRRLFPDRCCTRGDGVGHRLFDEQVGMAVDDLRCIP